MFFSAWARGLREVKVTDGKSRRKELHAKAKKKTSLKGFGNFSE